MSPSTVRIAQPADKDGLARLRVALWPDGSIEEHTAELEAVLSRGRYGTLPMAILIAQDPDGQLIGFIEVGIRSHADGCDVSHPVGFIEGWFVSEPFRGQGIGRSLMKSAESWARTYGCREMASDALLDNAASQGAHMALGYEEVDRCVHFKKWL